MQIKNQTIMVEGVEYDEFKVRVLNGALREHEGHRSQNVLILLKYLIASMNLKLNSRPLYNIDSVALLVRLY